MKINEDMIVMDGQITNIGEGVIEKGNYLYKESDGKQYYFDETGKMYYGWKTIDGKKCFFGTSDKHMLTGGSWSIDGKKYYFNQDGSQYIGWKTLAGEKYYFSERAVAGLNKANKNMNKGRAQDIEKPCNTVGSHLAKVSLNSTDPVLFIKNRYRRFTPREVARIQSFPENYKLSYSESAQYRALGNAIAPLVMWYIARDLAGMID